MIDYVYFINLDEYLLAWNHQSSTWFFFFSLYVQNFISVSNSVAVFGTWAMGGIFVAVVVTSERAMCGCCVVLVCFLSLCGVLDDARSLSK